MTKSPKLTEADLRQFVGRTKPYRVHDPIPTIALAHGVQRLADAANAHWLLDIIAAAQMHDERVRSNHFQIWTLTVRTDRSALLTCEDDTDDCIWYRGLSHTDFPLENIVLWLSSALLYLPEEQ